MVPSETKIVTQYAPGRSYKMKHCSSNVFFFLSAGRLLDQAVATCMAGQFFSDKLLRNFISSATAPHATAVHSAAASANYTLQTTLGERGRQVAI